MNGSVAILTNLFPEIVVINLSYKEGSLVSVKTSSSIPTKEGILCPKIVFVPLKLVDIIPPTTIIIFSTNSSNYYFLFACSRLTRISSNSSWLDSGILSIASIYSYLLFFNESAVDCLIS